MVHFLFGGLNSKLSSFKFTHTLSQLTRTFVKRCDKKPPACRKAKQCIPKKGKSDVPKKKIASEKKVEAKKGKDVKKTKQEPVKKVKEKKPGWLTDKVALVTGGAHGIGKAVVVEMLKKGIRGITIADIDTKAGCQTIKDLTCQFGEDRIIFIECDVADCNSVDWAFKKTLQFHDDINIVVNNAGIINDVKWDRQLNVNLGSCLAGSLLGMQYMARSCNGAGGAVVNVASIISLIPSSGCPVHTMTQHGIVGFSRALGYQTHYKRTGVKIIAYCPGLTNTKILKDAKKNAINDNFAKEFAEEIEDCELQKPESVAKGIIRVLEKAPSGSVWISECDEEPFEIQFPSITELKPKEQKKKAKSKAKC